MSQSPTIQKIPPRNKDFTRNISGGIHNLNRCYQCSMCSDGCPLAYAMDWYPNQIIHMVKLGLKETVLGSNTIWLCASCETCATRCPNKIDIVGLMDALRVESRRDKVNTSVANIMQFHESFVAQIKLKGRVDEMLLITSYELKSREFLSLSKVKELAAMAYGMIKRGRIKVPSLKRYAPAEMKRIYKQVFSHGK